MQQQAWPWLISPSLSESEVIQRNRSNLVDKTMCVCMCTKLSHLTYPGVLTGRGRTLIPNTHGTEVWGSRNDVIKFKTGSKSVP